MEGTFVNSLDDALDWASVDTSNIQDLLCETPTDDDSNLHSERSHIFFCGSHPKLEDRIFSFCTVCEQSFNPHAVDRHKKYCPGKSARHQHKESKKKIKSKKKPPGSPLPLRPRFKKIKSKKKPPGSPLPQLKSNKKPSGSPLPLRPRFKKESPGPPVLSKFSDIAPGSQSRLAPDVLPLTEPLPSTSASARPAPPVAAPEIEAIGVTPPPLSPDLPAVEDPPPTTSRHKKSKRNAKARDFDPAIHCGAVDAQKGPCMRSINCSTHKSKKGAKRGSKKADKKPEVIHELGGKLHFETPLNSSQEYLFSTTSETDLDTEIDFNKADLEEIQIVVDDLNPILTPINEIVETELHDEVESDDPSNLLESGYCSVETTLSTKSSPVLYYNPISPIFVVTPVQFIQKENTVFVESPQRAHQPPQSGFFLSLPETTTNIRLYKSHPKPAFLPTYGARKVGGAILSSYKRLEYQRNDIKEAISFKRAAAETLNSSDSKQLKLVNDVNGFMLHTEMSEVAETPQNHCIQENINLLNMK